MTLLCANVRFLYMCKNITPQHNIILRIKFCICHNNVTNERKNVRKCGEKKKKQRGTMAHSSSQAPYQHRLRKNEKPERHWS